MNEAHEIAKKELSIKGIVLRQGFATLDDDFDLLDADNTKVQVQTFRKVQTIKEVSLEKDGVDFWEYHFIYACGIRLVEEIDDNGHEEDIVEDPRTLVEVKAKFLATYYSKIKLEQSAIEAFSEDNVGYHVWPYWREYVQSSCLRMKIEPLETPMYICNSSI